MYCLFEDDEPKDNFVTGLGILHNFGFHPQRLEECRYDVYDYLSQLPHTFRKDGGGGWSFLEACVTSDGVQWGEHANMEQLFALGCALKLAEPLLLRERWAMLPGSVPYFVLNL